MANIVGKAAVAKSRRSAAVCRTLTEGVRAPDLMPEAWWKDVTEVLGLSGREAAVLRCALYEDDTMSMARRLALSPHTVHTYRDRLFRKLRVSSMAQAIAVVFSVHLELLIARNPR